MNSLPKLCSLCNNHKTTCIQLWINHYKLIKPRWNITPITTCLNVNQPYETQPANEEERRYRTNLQLLILLIERKKKELT
jgi:hypothetical protein